MDPRMRHPWTKEEFEQQLRAKGTHYHIHHPFHIAMNSGLCTKAQVQGWVYNRFYYQISIPVKDASVLANMPNREQRRQWVYYATCKSLKLRTRRPIAMQIDGDPVGYTRKGYPPVTFTVVPQALKVIVPQKISEGLFSFQV